MTRLPLVAALVLVGAACLGNDFEPAPVAIDGIPDCTTGSQWGTELAPSPDAEGLDTPEAALRRFLFDYQRQFNGRILVVGTRGSFIVDGREGVVANASEAPGGGWLVLAYEGCERFEGVDDFRGS